MILVIPLLVQDFTVLEIIPSMQSSNINVTKKSWSPYKEKSVDFCYWQGRGTAKGKKILLRLFIINLLT